MTNQNTLIEKVLKEMILEQQSKTEAKTEETLTEASASGADSTIFAMWAGKNTKPFQFYSLKNDNKAIVTNDFANFIRKDDFDAKVNRFVKTFTSTKQKDIMLISDTDESNSYLRTNGAKTYFWRERFVATNGSVNYDIDDVFDNIGDDKDDSALWAKALLEFRRHVANAINRHKLKVVTGNDVLKKLMSKDTEKNPEKFFNEYFLKEIVCKPFQVDDVVYAQFSFNVGYSLKKPFSDNINFYSRPCDVTVGRKIDE